MLNQLLGGESISQYSYAFEKIQLLHHILPFKQLLVSLVHMYASWFRLQWQCQACSAFTCCQGSCSLLSHLLQLLCSCYHFFLLNQTNTLKLCHDLLVLFVLKLGLLHLLFFAGAEMGIMRRKVLLVELQLHLFEGLSNLLLGLCGAVRISCICFEF